MSLSRFHISDLILGIVSILIGGFVFYVALDYAAGTTSLMGPGYLPRAVGGLMIILGGIVLLRAALGSGEGPALPHFEIRACAAVMLAVLAFAFLIDRMGFVPAVVAAAILSALANPNARPVQTLVLSVILAIMASAIFVWGLQLNAELFRWPKF